MPAKGRFPAKVPAHKIVGITLLAELRIARWERAIAAAIKRAMRIAQEKSIDTLTADGYFDSLAWDAAINKEVVPAVETVMAEIRSLVGRSLAAGSDRALPIPDFTNQIARLVERARGLSSAIAEDIALALQTGMALGEGIPALSVRVSNVFGVMKYRSNTIARTEVISATNAASIETGRLLQSASGREVVKMWLATTDSFVREAHAEAHGQVVPLDDAFDVDGELLDYPGDPSGSPENTINCRCTVVEVDAEDADVLDSFPLTS